MGCDIHVNVEVYKKGFGWDRVATNEWPDFDCGRNYRLFGVLANVRNGWGFAGCDTGDAIKPISEPKGMPDECDFRTRDAYEEWGADAHSASWLTLAELENYEWGAEHTIRGFVDKKVAEEFRKTGKQPEEWCGFTTRQDVEQIEWRKPIAESCKFFVEKFIPALRALKEREGGEDVRIVFWFDN